MEQKALEVKPVEEVSFMNFETIEEFDHCESGFLAKKYFLLNWLLS